MVKYRRILQIVFTTLICLTWLINGLFCKVLNLVPRHQLIVSRIIGEEYVSILTKVIGVSEMLVAVWILSKIKSRACSIFQMTIVASMNIIEFVCASDLLLHGRFNIVFASFFILIIYINEFALKQREVVVQ
jgi:hypothetical protein